MPYKTSEVLGELDRASRERLNATTREAIAKSSSGRKSAVGRLNEKCPKRSDFIDSLLAKRRGNVEPAREAA